MNRTAALLISLSLGCASVREQEPPNFACTTTIRAHGAAEKNGKPSYLVESRIVKVTGEGAFLKEAQKLSVVCVEDEPAKLFVGEADPFGNALGGVSDGFELSVLVPNAAVSKDAVVEARVKKDNLTVWFDEQKVPVERHSGPQAKKSVGRVWRDGR